MSEFISFFIIILQDAHMIVVLGMGRNDDFSESLCYIYPHGNLTPMGEGRNPLFDC
jgi:hypothetical protein